jgi:hypothetical protein
VSGLGSHLVGPVIFPVANDLKLELVKYMGLNYLEVVYVPKNIRSPLYVYCSDSEAMRAQYAGIVHVLQELQKRGYILNLSQLE